MRTHRRNFLEKALLAGAVMRVSDSTTLKADSKGGEKSLPGKLRKVHDLDVLRDEAYYFMPGPSPVVFPNGEILLAMRRSPAQVRGHYYPETEGCLISSQDSGKSWGETRVIDFGGVSNVNLTLLRDGTLLYVTTIYDPITPGTYDLVKDLPQNSLQTRGYRLASEGKESRPPSMLMGVRVRRSTDRGRTWSPGYWVSPVPDVLPLLPGYPAPVHQRSKIIQRRSGALILPVYAYPNPWRVFLMTSNDGGLTWSFTGEIAGPKNRLDLPESVRVDGFVAFNETCVHETPSGKLVAFIRIHTGSTESTRSQWTGDSNPAGHLLTATSQDGGRTWGELRRRQLWGYPFSTVEMPGGRVLLAYGYRQAPFGVRARLLDAECTRIDEAEEFIVRDDGAMRDLGYPQSAVLKDGRVFIAYYFNSRKDNGKQRYLAATILEEA
ncbi:MAG: glycoside hydrolase [Acidobacteria bacterium]|nr:glycoside hydrolase [Acidobacteriota bacterium]